MVTGIVLVNVERAMIQTVIEDLGKIPGVAEIYAVAGEYDLVVIIRVKSNADLAEIIASKLPSTRLRRESAGPMSVVGSTESGMVSLTWVGSMLLL